MQCEVCGVGCPGELELSSAARAQRIVNRGGGILLPGDDVDVTFKRGELTRLIQHAIRGAIWSSVASMENEPPPAHGG